jgi:putative pyruvate formate lyase activating enzyme
MRKINEKINILQEIVPSLYKRLEECNLCPRNCRVNRLKGEKGYCGVGKDLVVYTYFLHQGEEPPISGKKGSGTIFFSGCSLKCVYCQNYKFSHFIRGKSIKEEELAEIMLNLQKQGAHNINLVTPTHFLPQILLSLSVAFKEGLNLPVVYNTSGYEKEEIVKAIDKIIDVYLTDARYIASDLALRYSNAENYPQINKKMIETLYSLKTNRWEDGLLKEGVITRVLVLPGYTEETVKMLKWLKNNFPDILVSVMFQYRPYFKASLYPEINRSISFSEYSKIKSIAENLGLKGWIQEFNPPQDLAGVNFSPPEVF